MDQPITFRKKPPEEERTAAKGLASFLRPFPGRSGFAGRG